MLKVVIADDHRLILAGIKRSLEDDGGFDVVGEASTGEKVLPLVAQTNPDLVVLDLRMPGMDGLICLDQIKKRHPSVKVVVLSVSTDEKLIENVLKRGASAYIVKSVNPVDLPGALRQAVEGNVFSTIGLPDATAAGAAKAAGLTDREAVILGALARGLSNEQIAKELWVAEQTVKFHLTNVYRKLGVSNRTEAARYAYQQGLVDSPLVRARMTRSHFDRLDEIDADKAARCALGCLPRTDAEVDRHAHRLEVVGAEQRDLDRVLVDRGDHEVRPRLKIGDQHVA